MSEYHLLPTRYPKTRRVKKDGKWTTEYTRSKPEGWVELGPKNVQKSYYDTEGKWHSETTFYKGILGPTKRLLTPGSISQRISRNTCIEDSQAYIRKVITNPRTPSANRKAALDFIQENPTMFTPVAEGDLNTDYGRWARRRNGNAKHGFIKEMIEEARRFQ